MLYGSYCTGTDGSKSGSFERHFDGLVQGRRNSKYTENILHSSNLLTIMQETMSQWIRHKFYILGENLKSMNFSESFLQNWINI